MNDEIKEILNYLDMYKNMNEGLLNSKDKKLLLDYITNLQKENERLNKEVAKLHIIQEEYGSHIENTHIIDDYQKTYFMTNKWLIELKDGRFVDINVLNSYYEDYKSKVEKAVELIHDKLDRFDCDGSMAVSMSISYFKEDLLNILQNGSDEDENI